MALGGVAPVPGALPWVSEPASRGLADAIAVWSKRLHGDALRARRIRPQEPNGEHMAHGNRTVQRPPAQRVQIEILRVSPPEFVECDLLAPEAFPDAPPTERERLFFRSLPSDVDPRHSPTVWHRLASSCSGWVDPPAPQEFYDAVRTPTPTPRQQDIVRMWASEADTGEVIRAWVEGVYTWRQLAGALHRSDATRNGYLNVMLNQLADASWDWEPKLKTEPWFGRPREKAVVAPAAPGG